MRDVVGRFGVKSPRAKHWDIVELEDKKKTRRETSDSKKKKRESFEKGAPSPPRMLRAFRSQQRPAEYSAEATAPQFTEILHEILTTNQVN